MKSAFALPPICLLLCSFRYLEFLLEKKPAFVLLNLSHSSVMRDHCRTSVAISPPKALAASCVTCSGHLHPGPLVSAAGSSCVPLALALSSGMTVLWQRCSDTDGAETQILQTCWPGEAALWPQLPSRGARVPCVSGPPSAMMTDCLVIRPHPHSGYNAPEKPGFHFISLCSFFRPN